MSYQLINIPKSELLKDDLDPAIICPHCSMVIKLSSLAKTIDKDMGLIAFGIYECTCGGRFDFGPGMSVRLIPREAKE